MDTLEQYKVPLRNAKTKREKERVKCLSSCKRVQNNVSEVQGTPR